MSSDLRNLIDRAATTSEDDRGEAFCEGDVLDFMRCNLLTESGFCDKFAEETSMLFLSGQLSFELADRAINALSWYAAMGRFKIKLLPDFSWKIHLAFDAGEHGHGGRVENPIESITIPSLRELLSRSRA